MPNQKTILVTGAAGFIGSHLCQRLVEVGHQVIGVDNLNLSYSPKLKLQHLADVLDKKLFHLAVGDITDKLFLDNLFKKYKITHLVHLAARAGVRHSIDKPLWFKESNISGTINLLELAKQYNLANFIFASSSSVYGETNQAPFKESQNTDYPISPYAASKKTGELFCYTYSYLVDVPITVLRFFNVYGPKMRPELAMPLFVDGIMNGTPIKQFGDGTMKRNYTYIDDIVDGILKALDKPHPYIILNLGGDQVVSLNELIETLENVCQRPAIRNVLPKPKGDVSLTCADNSLALKHLNWRPKVSFRQGCENYFKWYLDQRKKAAPFIHLPGITKRVLIFSLNYVPFMSGAEVAVKRITDKIDHYTYDLITARFRSDLPRQEKIGNLQVYRVGWGSSLDKFLYPLLALFKSWQLKRQHKYDIVWGIMASYAGLSAMLFKFFNQQVKYLLSLQKGEDQSYFFKYTWFWRPIYKMIYSRADAIQATSSFHVNRARKYGYRGRVEVIPNGVIADTRHKYSQMELAELKSLLGFNHQDIILTVKTTALKRDYDILDAMLALKFLDQSYKLMVLCPREVADDFKQLAAQVNLTGRVKVVAYDLNFDLIKYLQISHMFLKISTGPRLGTSLVEAMLCQLPIVASNVPGVNDIITHNSNGLLCRPGDVKDLVSKIKILSRNQKLKEKLIQHGLASVKRVYDWETVAEGLKKIFETI